MGLSILDRCTYYKYEWLGKIRLVSTDWITDITACPGLNWRFLNGNQIEKITKISGDTKRLEICI